MPGSRTLVAGAEDRPPRGRNALPALALVIACGLVGACATMATQGLATNLSAAVLNNDDPKLVRDGAPAHLLLLEGLLEGDPDSRELLLAASSLYGAYATVFVEDEARAKSMAEKSLHHAERALCTTDTGFCESSAPSFEQFEARVDSTGADALPALYAYAAALATRIQAGGADDYDALAELPKVEVMMERVVELDETMAHGQAHLYLAAIHARLPATLGGKPELARAHFQRAIEISDGRDLRAKVEYARRYARLTFDRQLHDRLLREVIEADPDAPGLTLSNVIAQQEARRLLESGDEFFG